MEKAQAEVRRVFDGKGNADEELKFLKGVVKETLRLHPSLPVLIPREGRETCEINRYEIPKKTLIIVNAWAIGRVEAERFYPDRFLDSSIDYKGTDFGYIPFGAGRRMYHGILFSLPIIELSLAQYLDMTEALGLVVRTKLDLHLIPIPYNPSHAQ
ncbi:hypothetical protein PVL29_013554 [Vitis rotundifolia]|uniref:Cytochrome P450 n=1 Tax=Vitis rotundifolia TaxID=103349 RepID=A0AA39DPG9_VITRO|nr:hypothetical protein PVL29_013554 [Vitis rotundifolia]